MLTAEQKQTAAELAPIAWNTAARISARHPSADPDEVRSECHLAMIQAVRSYRPDRGTSLRNWVISCCRQRCLSLLKRSYERPPVVFVQDRDKIESLTDRVPACLEQGVEDLPAFRQLTPRRKQILREYLKTGHQRRTAERLGITKAFVYQVVKSFVTRARRGLVA